MTLNFIGLVCLVCIFDGVMFVDCLFYVTALVVVRIMSGFVGCWFVLLGLIVLWCCFCGEEWYVSFETWLCLFGYVGGGSCFFVIHFSCVF